MLHIQFSKQQGAFKLDLNINTDSSGVIALFGHSGCGKSTTINLMAGLLQPDSGRLQLGDEVLFDSSQGISIASEQRRIGYVFQDARLFPHYTVVGNLRYGLQRTRGRTQDIGFDAVVELLGIGHLLQRRSFQLSGGEKQRVALGRALLAQPRLLLLDEPLASLDQARREEVLPYLERVRDQLGIPMVYVSHQFEEVLQLATHVVLMDQGRVLAQGNLPDISLRPELRALIGAEAIGTVVEGQVRSIDEAGGLAQIDVGHGQLSVDASGLQAGQQVRLQLLARDLILALQPPHGLSVRNKLLGVIMHIAPDEHHSILVGIDVGGVHLIARVTTAAAQELRLQIGLSLWVLVKAVTLRGHLYHGAASTG
ncbi:MAG: molybdenum ABC transporter ATP-binding protein [Steroidobacteraceae bacterium]